MTASSSTKIVALKQIISSGGHTYPIFIGFLPASQIIEVAAAPAFTQSTFHHDIATNVMAPPIRQLQRPLNTDRTSAISQLFNSTGEFMPNPVLLSENIFAPNVITVTPHSNAGVLTGAYEVSIQKPAPGAGKPLWILHGDCTTDGSISRSWTSV